MGRFEELGHGAGQRHAGDRWMCRGVKRIVRGLNEVSVWGGAFYLCPGAVTGCCGKVPEICRTVVLQVSGAFFVFTGNL